MSVYISVVVSVYNVEQYIEPCIESIVRQSYDNIEIVCVDDGSTDRCPQILDEFAILDSRIHVIHKEHGGVVSAKKAGIENARGDYVIHVDGDDYIAEDRIEHLAECIEKESVDTVIMAGEHRVIRNESYLREAVTEYRSYWQEEICNMLLPQFIDSEGNFNLNWWLVSVATRRDIAKCCQLQLDNRITYLDDFAVVMLILQNSKKVTVIKETGYYYVRRENSITKNEDPGADELIRIAWNFIKKTMRREWWKIISPKLAKVCIAQLIYKRYDVFISEEYPYLYPFLSVKRGEKIVVYGSGLFGTGLMRALIDSSEYEVVAWIDINITHQPIKNIQVQAIDIVKKMEYDHVVIAQMDEKRIRNVSGILQAEGVVQDKMATINRHLLDIRYLPKDILEDE